MKGQNSLVFLAEYSWQCDFVIPSYNEISHCQLHRANLFLLPFSGLFSLTLLWLSLSSVVFIQAGDPILTYYPSWSAVSLLRQPAAVGAGGLCTESNPAGGSGVGVHQSFGFFWKQAFSRATYPSLFFVLQGFLESKSTACTRFFRDLASSCTSEPALDAATYYNFTVLKVGVPLSPLDRPSSLKSLSFITTFTLSPITWVRKSLSWKS